MKEVAVFASICFISFFYMYVLDTKRIKRKKKIFYEDIDKTINKLEQNLNNVNERIKRVKK